MNPPGGRTHDFGAGTLNDADHLVATLVQILEPRIKQIVRDEMKRAAFQWTWKTPAEAGAVLGLSAAGVRQRVRRGQLPGVNIDGRVYVDLAELDRQLRDRRLQ